MNPQEDQGNPFASILAQMQGGGQQQAQQMPQQAPQMPQPKIQGSSQQQTAEQMGPKQLMEGQEGTQSKAYVQAISALQNVITGETDARKIQLLRQLTQVIVQLLNAEQEMGLGELGTIDGGQDPSQAYSG